MFPLSTKCACNSLYTFSSFSWIWSHLLKKSLKENFIVCAVFNHNYPFIDQTRHKYIFNSKVRAFINICFMFNSNLL